MRPAYAHCVPPGSATLRARWITCNACGADSFLTLSSVGDWTIGGCGVCGLVYVNPAPFFEPGEEFSAISREFEYTAYMHRPIGEEILVFETRQLLLNMEEQVRLTGRRGRPGRFLDVGCGSGASVRAAADLGWQSMGIDIDPALVDEGREQLQVDLLCSDLLHSDLPDQGFDFIKLRDVIEHLPNPFEVLAKTRDLLASDGIMLITTPNEGSLPNRARLAAKRKRRKVATVAPPHHLHAFEEATLRRTLSRAGLKLLEVKTTTPIDIRYVTSHNVAIGKHKALQALWKAGEALGKGSMLIAWVGK